MQTGEQQEELKAHIQQNKQHEGNIKYELASNCIGSLPYLLCVSITIYKLTRHK
jgi:quinol monooxygenase YgiN